MESAQNAVLAAVDELNGVLSLAEALLLAGRHLDLKGLDGEVATICGAAAALPPEEGRAARPALSGLLTRVEGLAVRLARPEDRSPGAGFPGPGLSGPGA